MEFFEPSDDQNYILNKVSRFENMLQNQDNLYFDREEFEELIDYYINQNDFEQAEMVVNYAIDQHPYSVEIKLSHAQILLGRLKYKEALNLLNSIEDLDPKNSDLLMTKGTVYSRLKMTEKALLTFHKALEGAEFKDEVYLLMALEYQHNLEYEKAIEQYKLSLKVNPENETALFELHICYECVSNFDDAIVFYKELLDKHPYSETAWFNLAGIYCKLEEWDLAVDSYDFALAINPYFASAYFNKANALANEDRYEEAIKTYKETYEHESPNFITYCYIAECYERLEDVTKALKYYNRSLNENNDYAEAWLGKAICMDKIGNSTDALKFVKRAIELSPDEPDYWYTCAEIEEKLNFIEDAIASMHKAVSLDSTDPNLILDYLQMVHRNIDVELVFENIEEAIQVFPNNAKLIYFKSALLLERGSYQKAYHTFENALNMSYDDHEFIFAIYSKAKNNQNILELIDLYRK